MTHPISAWLRRHRWFALFVLLPVALVALYEGLIASDQFVSESRFVIRSPSQQSPQVTTLASLIQTTGMSAGHEQSLEVVDYIRSRSGLADLDRMGSVETLFSRPQADWLARYPAPWRAKARENLFNYYQKMVDARVDHESGLVVLQVRAFVPQDAQTLNRRLLQLSEQLVNTLNTRARTQQISEAEARVMQAQDRVRRARVALAAYRNANGLLDPSKQASSVLEVSTRLVSEQAALQAQLDQMLRNAPANPAIPGLRSRIEALGHSISTQTGRAVGTSQGIAAKLSGYENLTLEQEFASQNLLAASAALEQARAASARQQFYLERVVEPDLPDLAEYPHRLRVIITVAGAAILLYFIGWMFVVGILEHAPED